MQQSQVLSGVADQPLGDEETKSGAINRARNAYQAYFQKYSVPPTFSIGMEGGVALIRDETGLTMRVYVCIYVCIYFEYEYIFLY